MGLQILRSDFIVLYFLGVAVLGTIQFYYQLGLVTVKIGDIVPNHILSAESERITARKTDTISAPLLLSYFYEVFAHFS